MPAAAVIPAVATVGLAGASVATAGLTIGTALAVTGAIGATVGAIGNLTGNKTLGIAGMALGAVGAIGGVAGMAGAFDSASSLSSVANSADEVGGAVGGAGAASQDVIGSVTGTPAPADTMPTMATATGSASATYEPLGEPQGGLINNPAAPSADATPPAATPSTPGGATVGTPAVGGTTPTPGPYQATIDPTTGASITTVKPGMAQPTTTLDTTPSGTWSNIMAWVEKHPTLAMGGISAASSFLSGAFNPKTPAEVNALNAQASRSQAEVGLIGAQTGLINQQIANSSAVPIATRTRPAAATGIINQRTA